MEFVPQTKEGTVKKRSGRLHQWTTRHFILDPTTHTLSYKIKNDPELAPRATFELVAGCLVTDVIDENTPTKKLFSFWIVWPHDKKSKRSTSATADDDDSDNDVPATKSTFNEEKRVSAKREDLKHIVESEVLLNKRQRLLVEKQLERHQAHDAGWSTL